MREKKMYLGYDKVAGWSRTVFEDTGSALYRTKIVHHYERNFTTNLSTLSEILKEQKAWEKLLKIDFSCVGTAAINIKNVNG